MITDEIIKKALAYDLASDLHENWRNTRKKENGAYEPRLKISKDEEWNKNHGTDVVDIANCTFSELPSNWQYENLEAAKIVIDLVYSRVIAFDSISFEELEKMASIIHNEWLKRNTWVYDKDYGNPKLAVSYEKLSKEEQDKDKRQVILAQHKVLSYVGGLININELCNKYSISKPDKSFRLIK